MNPPDTATAISFLENWEPAGPWLLTAVDPETRNIETCAFDDPEPMQRWIERWQHRRNLYFSVNRTRPGLSTKATKNDISELLALHADIDPPKTPGFDLSLAQQEILDRLKAHEPPPSAIVFSGGGYQGFWRLDEPVAVNGNIAELEAYNVALEKALGGDHCHNIDRVMRVPGTVNLPDRNKRAAGRTAVTAELVYFHQDRVYKLADFTPHQPGAGGKPDGDKSRSAAAFRLAARMKAEDKTFEEWVEALQSDPDCRDWYYDKGDARQLRRTWDRAGTNTGDAPAFSEEALALNFAARHDGELRYTPVWSRWFTWTGTHWRADETLTAFDRARSLCRDASADPRAVKLARGIASAKTVAAVATLARSDRRIATDHRDWDSDPLKLAGSVMIDLRTGMTTEPQAEDLCTKITAAAPDDRECPLWHLFLEKVTDDNLDLQNYLQRVAGYCLTGLTVEHVLFFLYGTGANGKGVFLNTLRAIWNDYAVIAPMETFIEAQTDRHPTELALLRGARMVIAQQTEQGRRWAEAKIKAMTGGDPIVARHMRQDFFEYVPQFKLLIAGNHKPSLRGVDEAIRRRFHLVPFTVTIPPAERDVHLAENLKPEWPGILRWAIDGCLEWHRIGLAPPRVVLDATEKYLQDQDTLGQWLEDCCGVDPTYRASSNDLYQSWKGWCEAGALRPGSKIRFGLSLQDRGFVRVRDERGNRQFEGLALKASPNA